VSGVRSAVFTLRFAGEAVELDGGRFWAETQAVAAGVDTLALPFDGIAVDQAICRRQLEIWADGSLVQTGEITFGRGDTMTFRARGALGLSPDPGIRHGTPIL